MDGSTPTLFLDDRSEKALKTVSGLLSSQITSREITAAIDGMNMAWIESDNEIERKVGLITLFLLLHLSFKNNMGTQPTILKCPLYKLDSGIYLASKWKVDVGFAIRVKKAQHKRSKLLNTKGSILSYILTKPGEEDLSPNSIPLLLNLSEHRLKEVFDSPALLSCIPDPAEHRVFYDLTQWPRGYWSRVKLVNDLVLPVTTKPELTFSSVSTSHTLSKDLDNLFEVMKTGITLVDAPTTPVVSPSKIIRCRKQNTLDIKLESTIDLATEKTSEAKVEVPPYESLKNYSCHDLALLYRCFIQLVLFNRTERLVEEAEKAVGSPCMKGRPRPEPLSIEVCSKTQRISRLESPSPSSAVPRTPKTPSNPRFRINADTEPKGRNFRKSLESPSPKTTLYIRKLSTSSNDPDRVRTPLRNINSVTPKQQISPASNNLLEIGLDSKREPARRISRFEEYCQKTTHMKTSEDPSSKVIKSLASTPFQSTPRTTSTPYNAIKQPAQTMQNLPSGPIKPLLSSTRASSLLPVPADSNLNARFVISDNNNTQLSMLSPSVAKRKIKIMKFT